MKNNTVIAIALTSVAVTASIGFACLAGCAKKTTKQTAVGYLDQEETTPIVTTVDTTDGYSCEFVRGAIYLYDEEVHEDTAAVAMGISLPKDVFEDYIQEAETDPNHKIIKDGVMYSSDGQMVYLVKVSDTSYFGVFADNVNTNEMEKIIDRITVKPDVVV